MKSSRLNESIIGECDDSEISTTKLNRVDGQNVVLTKILPTTKSYPTSPFLFFFFDQMRKISAESKEITANGTSDEYIDETATPSKKQSSHLLPRPTKKRKTTQFATHLPKICQLWKSLSPQEKLKWEQFANMKNASSQTLERDKVDTKIGPNTADLY